MRSIIIILLIAFSISCASSLTSKRVDILKNIVPISNTSLIYKNFKNYKIIMKTIECEEGAIYSKYTIYDKATEEKLLSFNTECVDFGNNNVNTVYIHSEIYHINNEIKVGSDITEILKNHEKYKVYKNNNRFMDNVYGSERTITYLDSYKNIGLITYEQSENPFTVKEIYLLLRDH